MSDLIRATWVGIAGCELNGQELVPGETIVDVPADEARESDNWAPVKTAKPAHAAAATSTGAGE